VLHPHPTADSCAGLDSVDGVTVRILDGENSLEIASVVGTPLIIDNATTKRVFGHYA